MVASAAGAVVTSSLAGCVKDPVTGKRTLILMSEAEEIKLDQAHSPHQFSADYGPVQDSELNAYISRVGSSLAARSHRSDMPYSFRVVNAAYINAYAFPGGSIAATRGIMVELASEAELAGLLGHEIGHVNARHTAERATRSMLAAIAVSGTAVAAQAVGYGNYAGIVQGLGQIGSGALLAHYSRENEREADSLGMKYMARAGQNPEGMVELMEILMRSSRHRPSAIELMFATHPMSEERFKTAESMADSHYRSMIGRPFYRERFMDHTVGIRRIRDAISNIQLGEREMSGKRFSSAENYLDAALRQAPDDYAGLVIMAKCQLARKDPEAAGRYAEKAIAVYPGEAQAHNVKGMTDLMQKKFASAYEQFSTCEKILPGNPDTGFLKGFALEGMDRKERAAREYYRYLNSVRQGPAAKYAYQRLVEWGYIKDSR